MRYQPTTPNQIHLKGVRTAAAAHLQPRETDGYGERFSSLTDLVRVFEASRRSTCGTRRDQPTFRAWFQVFGNGCLLRAGILFTDTFPGVSPTFVPILKEDRPKHNYDYKLIFVAHPTAIWFARSFPQVNSWPPQGSGSVPV